VGEAVEGQPDKKRGPHTLPALLKVYGAQWEVWEGAGGGYIALRHRRVSAWEDEHGLSEVVCAPTIEQMALRLGAQARLERGLYAAREVVPRGTSRHPRDRGRRRGQA
jgi:hypothetical protein